MVDIYNKMINDLDNEFQSAMESQEKIVGNQKEVFQRVGENMLAEKKYQEQRSNIVKLRDDIIGVSPAVEAFLRKKEPVSKFDVDAGKAKIDTSMNPLGGKEL